MPQIRSISLDGGIFIETVGDLSDISIPIAQFPATGSAKEEGDALTSTCQQMVEKSVALDTIPSDDPVKQPTPILTPNERIEGDSLIITNLYIAVHVFNYPVKSQSDFTVMASNSPIGGDWWL